MYLHNVNFFRKSLPSCRASDNGPNRSYDIAHQRASASSSLTGLLVMCTVAGRCRLAELTVLSPGTNERQHWKRVCAYIRAGLASAMTADGNRVTTVKSSAPIRAPNCRCERRTSTHTSHSRWCAPPKVTRARLWQSVAYPHETTGA